MLVGYARVSTKRQRLDLQVKALTEAKCDIVISECLSGAEHIGKGLIAAAGSCGSGDTLVVWRLDRLSRNLRELLALLDVLTRRRVRLKVLSGTAAAIDLSQTEGLALYAAYAAFAELELGMNRERTLAGLRVSGRTQACRLSETARSARRRHGSLCRAFNRLGRSKRKACVP